MCHQCTSYDVKVDEGVDGDGALCWRLKSLVKRLWGSRDRIIKVPQIYQSLERLRTPQPDSNSLWNPLLNSSSTGSTVDVPPSLFCLEKKGIRVLLYRECDRRGRKLLYDSQNVVRTKIPEQPGQSQCSTRLFRTPLSGRSGVGTPASTSPGPLYSKGAPHINVEVAPHRARTGVDRRKSSTGEVYVEVRNGYGYQYLKGACDTKQIGELVFGSVALAFRGASSKLHLMKEPSRLLLSRTSRAPRSYHSSQTSCDTGIEDSFSSLSNSLSELQFSKVESLDNSFGRPLLRPSLPLEVFPGSHAGVKTSLSEDDSGFSGPPSPFSSTCGSYLNPGSLPITPMGTSSPQSGSGNSLKSSGSLSSLQRRFLRNVATSLESFGFASNDEDHKDENRLSSYQTKLGLAVIIETKQESPEIEKTAEDWWFKHQEVLETLINKLQATLEMSYLHRAKFVSSVYQAVSQFQQELEDLVYAPRLPEPLWLSLLGANTDSVREKLHSKLIGSLSCLLSNYDTKQTNFFVSKLLTGVLTHHLGWVSTVGPQISTLPNSSCSHKEASSSMTDVLSNYLSKTQPYNALWGQLCELTGSIGYPSRLTRTIVVGTDKTLLNHILTLLSYIIRCSQVVENHFEEKDWSVEWSDPPKSDCESVTSITSVTTLVETSTTKSNLDPSSRITLINSQSSNSRQSIETKTDESRNEIVPNRSDTLQNVVKNNNLCLKKLKSERTNCESNQRKGSLHSSDSDLEALRLKPSKNLGLLTTSKTMSNLAEMMESADCSSMSPSKCLSPMYPNLRDMDDHRESFGLSEKPVFQTNVIAEKVKKLCRVPDIIPNTRETPEIKVTGEKINLELEEGGKVLFILGENERLEGLKPKREPSPSDTYNQPSNENNPELLHSVNSRRVSSPNLVIGETVTALPHPVDFKRINTFRMQGKSASALSSVGDTLKPSNPVYPSLTELKKKLTENPLSLKSGAQPVHLSHRRNMSDPTNGAFLARMPPYQKNLGVLHETIEQSKKSCEIAGNGVKSEPNSKRTTLLPDKKKNDDEKASKKGTTLGNNLTLEEWTKVDEHSTIGDLPRVKLRPEKQTNLKMAESLLGGVLDHYSSIFLLHGTTQTDQLEEQLRADLSSAAQHPVLSSQTSEAVAIVAEVGRWEIELVSSHSYSIERKVPGGSSSPINYGGVPVMISPLVSQISDSLLNLIRIGTPPQFVIQCLEHHLRGVYLKSQLLSEYLLGGAQSSLCHCGSYAYLGGQSLYNLSELTQTLGIDLNDLPLLLSVASTHTPALTQMFGLTFK